MCGPRPERLQPISSERRGDSRKASLWVSKVDYARTVKGNTICIGTICVPLNRAGNLNARGPQGGASRLTPLLSALGGFVLAFQAGKTSARPSRLMRVGRRVENWIIVRALSRRAGVR